MWEIKSNTYIHIVVFLTRDFKMQKMFGKALKSWGLKSLNLKAHKLHSLCIFTYFRTLSLSPSFSFSFSLYIYIHLEERKKKQKL